MVDKMTHEDVKKFIKKNPNCVVTYIKEKHLGYNNLDPYRTGIIFGGELYNVFLGGLIERRPYICIETERSSGESYSGIEVLSNEFEPKIIKEYIAGKVLESLIDKKGKASLEFDLIMTGKDGKRKNLAIANFK